MLCLLLWGCSWFKTDKDNERKWSGDRFYVDTDKLPLAVTRHAKELFDLAQKAGELCNQTYSAIMRDKGCYTQLFWYSPYGGGDIDTALPLPVSKAIENDPSIIQIKSKCIWPYLDDTKEPYKSIKATPPMPGTQFWCTLRPFRTSWGAMPKGIPACSGGTPIWRRFPERKLEEAYSGFALTVPSKGDTTCTHPVYILDFGDNGKVDHGGQLDMEVIIWDEEVIPLKDFPKEGDTTDEDVTSPPNEE